MTWIPTSTRTFTLALVDRLLGWTIGEIAFDDVELGWADLRADLDYGR